MIIHLNSNGANRALLTLLQVFLPVHVSLHYVIKVIMGKSFFLLSFELVSTGTHIIQLMVPFKKCFWNWLLSSFLITRENHNVIIILSSQLADGFVFWFVHFFNLNDICLSIRWLLDLTTNGFWFFSEFKIYSQRVEWYAITESKMVLNIRINT